MKSRSFTITSRLDQIKVFFEKPSDEHQSDPANPTAEDAVKRISACELFSIFTADIIKKDVLFFR